MGKFKKFFLAEAKTFDVEEGVQLTFDDHQDPSVATLFVDGKEASFIEFKLDLSTPENEDWLFVDLVRTKKDFKGMGYGNKIYYYVIKNLPKRYRGLAVNESDIINPVVPKKIHARMNGFKSGGVIYMSKDRLPDSI